MVFGRIWPKARGPSWWAAALFAMMLAPMPAPAAFHLWQLNEIYTNNTGTLQFIEMKNANNFENFVANQQIKVSNVGATQTNTFTIPSTGNLPGDTINKSLLFGTSGLQAAGGPAPDFIIPDGFLFSGGGTINFFGLNSGPYTAMPTDGVLSRTWTGGDAPNTPTNYAGVTGFVVPEPTTMVLTPLAVGLFGAYRVLTRRRQSASTVS
jgi:serralysin